MRESMVLLDPVRENVLGPKERCRVRIMKFFVNIM